MTTKKDIKKKITLLAMLDFPASIMIVLGLYCKFSADNVFHPLLRDENVAHGLLVKYKGLCPNNDDIRNTVAATPDRSGQILTRKGYR